MVFCSPHLRYGEAGRPKSPEIKHENFGHLKNAEHKDRAKFFILAIMLLIEITL
jgi:hypothetical protein